uniref:Uncharacterized protein n=1 Tax=Plectus sambesii TaxID=2011161 RepID=A0A914VU47_9BILA
MGAGSNKSSAPPSQVNNVPTRMAADNRNRSMNETFNTSMRSLDDSFLLRPMTCTIRVTDENGRVIHDSPPIRRIFSPNGPRRPLPTDTGLSIPPNRENTIAALKSATPATSRQREETRAKQAKQEEVNTRSRQREETKVRPAKQEIVNATSRQREETRVRPAKQEEVNMKTKPPPPHRSSSKNATNTRTTRDTSKARSTSRKAPSARRVP